MENKTIRILCVDDNELVANAIEIKLRLAGGFAWIGRLESANELVAEAQRLQPDIVLLDLDMPGVDPFEAIRELHEREPAIRVVVFSGHVRNDWISEAVDAGAWGYVSKNYGAQAIVPAIERVADGEFVVSPDVEAEFHRG